MRAAHWDQLFHETLLLRALVVLLRNLFALILEELLICCVCEVTQTRCRESLHSRVAIAQALPEHVPLLKLRGSFLEEVLLLLC